MATTVWKGHLTFGLISLPVRLYRAARKEKVSLRYLHQATSDTSGLDVDQEVEPRNEIALPEEVSAGSGSRLPFDSLSRRSDTEQISWGKLSRFLCTVAESTLRTLDGYGLRGKLPARPALAPCIRFLSIDSHI